MIQIACITTTWRTYLNNKMLDLHIEKKKYVKAGLRKSCKASTNNIMHINNTYLNTFYNSILFFGSCALIN